MKTKAKKFSHKLLALFLAVLMAATCFSGVISAQASTMSDQKTYTDDSVEYNDLGWAILSDEQVATALLDYADNMLAQYGPKIDQLFTTLIPVQYRSFASYDASSRSLSVNAFVVTGSITLKFDSVDELFETLESVSSFISSNGSYLGTLQNLQLSAVNGIRRSNTSSTDIIRRVLGLLQQNSADYAGKDVIGSILRGEFSLGTLGNLLSVDIYDILGDLVGFTSTDYKSDFVYNFAQQCIFEFTDWYTDEEIENFQSGGAEWVFDDQLLSKLTTELLDKISVLVTYNQSYEASADGSTSASEDTSQSRYLEIKEKMNSDGMTYSEAATALGYDPNIIYSESYEDSNGNPTNVLLFMYGSPDQNGYATDETTKLTLDTDDTLFEFGYKALDIAWDTVLKGTLKLVHVNDSYNSGHGANFDNEYYYYLDKTNSWDSSNLANNYTTTNLNEWANDVYEDYNFDSASEFLSYVKSNLTYDRTASDDSTGSWSDIDETTLFAKLRYSPLADYGFDIETGPINLYLLQTGTPNLDAFFESEYTKYSSMAAALNDCLVAAVKDIFVSSDNIIGTRPDLDTTGDIETIDSDAIGTIVEKLVPNALKMVQYTADAIDANILKAFYDANGESATLDETNLESAMIPLLIACIGQINLGTGKLEKVIHPSDWDSCKDAEGVAYICLKEYLSYVLPEKDYSTLVSTDSDGKIEATLTGTIYPMCRDAVAYVIEAYVPLYDASGDAWHTESAAVDSTTTLFDLANSVLCYYGGDYDMQKTVNSGERAMGVGALIGVCDESGENQISTENTLWENIDLVVDQLLPIAGELQGTEDGKFDSKDLIINDIVNSILEIGEKRDSGYYGVSNFIYKLLTIVTASPIQNDTIVVTVYNVLKDLINGLFAARYTGQSYTEIVPDATSEHPFDDFFKVGVLAGTSGSDLGAIQKLICNFVEFCGFSINDASAYPDTILRGISFALEVVNSYIPEAITSIGNHQLKMATASFDEQVASGISVGSNVSSTITVTNNAVGVNNTYINKENVTQMSNYYIQVTSMESVIGGESTDLSLSSSAKEKIAPSESLDIPVTLTFTVKGSDTSSNCAVVVTYNVVDEDGNVLYEDLQTSAYKLLTSEAEYLDTVYDSTYHFTGSFDLSSANGSYTDEATGYSTRSSGNFNSLYAVYPTQVVVGTGDPSEISNYAFKFKNTQTALIGAKRSVDAIYNYIEDTVQSNDLSTAATEYTDDVDDVSVTRDNAIPVWDRDTGSLLKLSLYDYRVETSEDSGEFGEWNRGTDNAGYSSSEISSVVSANAGLEVETRAHVAYTLQEALNAGIIAAYHINENNTYDSMFVKAGNVGYDTLLSKIDTGIYGFESLYISSGKTTVDAGGEEYVSPFAYDVSSDEVLQSGTYERTFCFYNSSATSNCTITFTIGDTSTKSELQSSYEELSNVLFNYKPSDFEDTSVYTTAEETLEAAVAVRYRPSTPSNIVKLADTTEIDATTSETTSKTGDLAYVPYTTDNESVDTGTNIYTIPNSIKDNAYVGGDFTSDGDLVGGEDGVYYYDKEGRLPIYSPLQITTENADDYVTNGYDQAGFEVVEGEDGNYYLANSVVYATEWDTTTYSYPWQKPTDEQATNSDGDALYDQVQFNYYDSDGQKVTSKDNWSCKLPQYDNYVVENTGTVDTTGAIVDNRGEVTGTRDLISYVLSLVNSNVKDVSSELYNNISVVRTGLNEHNFNMLTFNKMVKMAKQAENNYTIDVTYTTEIAGKTQTVSRTGMTYTKANAYMDDLDEEGIEYTMTTDSTLSSVQTEEYQRLFNIYASKVYERGYQGKQLEAEILCASGNDYDSLTAVPATYDTDGSVSTEATVTKTSSAGEPRFGAWDSNGKLVNEGSTKYTTASWNAYVRALADAVDLATSGNGDYKYKTADNFNIDDKDSYTAEITNVYSADTALQKAEIALTEYASYTVTVADLVGGTVYIDGVAYTAPVAVETDQQIEISVVADRGYSVVDEITINGDKRTIKSTDWPYKYTVTSDTTISCATEKTGPDTYTVAGTVMIASDVAGDTYTLGITGIGIYAGSVSDDNYLGESGEGGAFSVEVPEGTTELVFHRENVTIDRTVTISGTADVSDAVVPVIICDYNGDTSVNILDMSNFNKVLSGDYNIYYDYNGDNSVNSLDKAIFMTFYNKTITYSGLTLA